ncbi:MAG TPA: methyltransferase domain-containing protein [Bryobacteraceae bacterium]|jgi:SAM-dependent methyltransferase
MEWFEDEEFWRELYPYMFPAERFRMAADQVSQLLTLTGLTGGTVLDLCCGPGRHSVEFARAGFHVTGVDRSPFLLSRARERASQALVSVEWVMEDMRRFTRPSAFDLACNIFTSFGYFEREDDDLLVLRNVRESLKPGGIFVMEMMGKERLARVWSNAICTDYPDGATLVTRPHLRDSWCRVHNEWTLLKDGRARTFQFDHSLYSGREIRDRLLTAGFAEVKLYGDLQGSEYGLDAMRLVAVARTPPSPK